MTGTVLKKFDDGHSPDVTSWKDLEKRMPFIFEFINDPKHCRRSEYMIQFKLCGEEGCAMCERVGRGVRTPLTSNNALRHTALSFVNEPIPDPNDKDIHQD